MRPLYLACEPHIYELLRWKLLTHVGLLVLHKPGKISMIQRMLLAIWLEIIFVNSTATIQVVCDIKGFIFFLTTSGEGWLEPRFSPLKNRKMLMNYKSTRLLAYDIKGCYRVMMEVQLENQFTWRKYKIQSIIFILGSSL